MASQGGNSLVRGEAGGCLSRAGWEASEAEQPLPPLLLLSLLCPWHCHPLPQAYTPARKFSCLPEEALGPAGVRAMTMLNTKRIETVLH